MVTRSISLGRTLLAAMMLGCLALGGCATIMGDNFSDSYATWGEENRPADHSEGLWGVSTKSQQVEKNLGVR